MSNTTSARPLLPDGADEWGTGANSGPNKVWDRATGLPFPSPAVQGEASIRLQTVTPTGQPAATRPQTPQTHGRYNRELRKHSRSPHSLMPTHMPRLRGNLWTPKARTISQVHTPSCCKQLSSVPACSWLAQWSLPQKQTKEALTEKEEEVRDLSLFLTNHLLF